MSIFVVKPTDNSDPIEVEAEAAEYDKATGATCFYNGTGETRTLVARLLNVSFHEKQD